MARVITKGSLVDVPAGRTHYVAEKDLLAIFAYESAGLLVLEQGFITKVNLTFANMVGYEPDELTDDFEMLTLVHPDDRDLVLKRVRGVRSSGGEGSLTPRRLIHKSGAIIRTESRATAIRSPNGGGAQLVEHRDVTERVLAEDAVVESEERLRAVFEGSPTAIVMLDYRTGARYRNPAYARMLGYTPEEFEDVEVSQFMPPETAGVAAGLRSGAPLPRGKARAQFVRKDGSLCDVEYELSYRLLDGERIGFISHIRDISEEVAARKALSGTEERFRGFVETMHSGLVQLNMRGEVEFFNPAMASMSGYTPAELSGMDFSLLIPEERRAETMEMRRRRLAGEEPQVHSGRSTILRKDGCELDVDVAISVLRSGGEVTGSLAEFRDVTSEVKAERGLRESEEQQQATVAALAEALVVYTTDQIVVDLNPAAERMFGISREEAIGRRATRSGIGITILDSDGERVPLDELPGAIAVRSGVTQTNIQLRLRNRLGVEFDVRENAAVINPPDLSGAPGTVVSTYTDVTAEVAAERAFRSILEAAPQPIIAVEETGTITEANEAAAAVFGWSLSEFIGQSVSVIASGDATDQLAEYLAQYALSGSASGPQSLSAGPPREIVGRRKDGSEVPLELSVSEIPGATPRKFVGVITDLTERIEMRDQLIAAQKSEALGTLVAGVAHDFNNLLTAIGGSLEIASKEPDPTKWLSRAQVATDRAAQLVEQLLQFARRQPPNPTIVDLGGLAVETVDLLRETSDRRLTFETSWSDDVRVWADFGQIQQLLMNLLMNASDAVLERIATTEGADAPFQARIDVSLSRPDEDGPWCELIVADNGAGMSTEVRERIFDPFFTTKGVGEGTGLGMSTVFAIVTNHDGSISVESDLGRGTTVRVQLPAAPAEITEGDGPEEQAPAHGPSGRGSILVVDDESIICELAEHLLTVAGYEVVALRSGEESLLELARHAYDLLLLDVNMPTPDGWRVLNQALKLNSEQRVLMMSGYALDQEAKDRGAAALLQKPFSGRQLIEAVNAVLGVRTVQ